MIRSPFEVEYGEQHLRQIAESVGAVFWMTDSSKGEMIYISPGYELIWGRTCESLYRSPGSWIEAVDEQDRARVLAALTERQASGDYDETYRILRPDGEVRWIRDRAFPVRDERGLVHRIAGVAEDVTQRKRTNDALRSSQQRYESLVDSLDGIIWEANPVTLDFTFVSRQAERISGFSSEAWFQPGFFTARLHPEDRATVVAHCVEMTARKLDHKLEYRLVGPDGRVVWVRDRVTVVVEDDQVTALRGVMADITAAQQAEQALRRSEENFRTLIESSPQVICVVRDGRIVYMNRAGGITFGYGDAAELVGRDVGDIVVPEELAQTRQRLEEAQAGAFKGVTDRRVVRRDGTLVDVEVVAVPMTFDGEASAVIIGRDVSDERRLRAQVALSSRMASVGTLAAGVAHEINNPLSFIAANLEFIQSELGLLVGPDSDEISVAIDEARKGAERIRLIVRDLKAYSRPDESMVGAVDVREVLESALAMAQNEVRHRARVIRVFGDVPRVSGNEARLGQVFLNLLVNAAHAIPPGAAEHNEIRLATSRLADGRVCVELTDTGSGIPADRLPHLFDPFFTTKAIGAGTGLGLFIVHGILAAMGAEVTVDSTVGVGTTFRVMLRPALDAEVTPEVAPVIAPPSRRLTLVAIDDEPIMLSLLRRMLPAHDVVTFTDPFEALEAIRRGDACDVIFCDLMMPTMMGSEFFALLRCTHPKLVERIVFLTGGAFTSAARHFLDTVPNRCIEKPFTRATVQKILDDRCG